MNVGEEIRVRAVDTRADGVGVARHDGAVVFVPSLVNGDTADVTIRELHKNYAIGELCELAVRSDKRISPLCPCANECGGCTLTHLTYEYENEIKRDTVRGALRRMGLPSDTVGETLFTESRIGYRNKLTVHFDPAKRTLGLFSEGTHDVVPLGRCMICKRETGDITLFLSEHADLLAAAQVTEITLQSSQNGGILVSIDAGGDIKRLAEALARKFTCISAVIRGDERKNHFVYSEYNGIKMSFSSCGFRQVNDGAFALLLDKIVALADECKFTSCCDLYCGSGVIGLSLAARFPAAKFYGVELNCDSISDAKRNAVSNRIENISFFCGDAAHFRESLPNGESPELIVVDPPRAGLSPKMRRELISLAPENIIYVSCNPHTMARDAAELVGCGYEFESATPVNMFPMTKHVECVVMMSKS